MITTLKCHQCGKELTQIDYDIPDNGPFSAAGLNKTKTMTLECPDVHCQVVYDKDLQNIVEYTIYFEDARQRRYKIKGYRAAKLTQFMIKTGNKPWNYQVALPIKRYLLFKPNKDGQLQGEAIFNKLKTLLTFS